MSPTSSVAATNAVERVANATGVSAQATAAAAHPARDAFDRIAPSYDNDFTDSLIGRLQREAVWRHLDALFSTGDRILDLGCGTAADAIHLARRGIEVEAVDVSDRMIAEAQQKIAAEGLAGRITTSILAIEDLGAWDRQSCLSTQVSHAPRPGDRSESDRHQYEASKNDRQDCPPHHPPFDGVISNFGALNCTQHLRPVAIALSRLTRPGGHLALCLISSFCLWETVFHGLQRHFAKAARRWTNGGRAAASFNGSAGFTVYYHPVREIVRAFQPEFRLQRHSGIGILVPPTYLEAPARRVPKLLKLAASIDQSMATWPVCRAAADHTLLVFTREREP